MKVKFFLCFMLCCMFFLTGCGNNNKDNVVKNITKKIENVDSYHLDGELEIINNESSYVYDVDVAYKKDNLFRVSLKNKINNHEQIILRNADGVYVLTPSLNKSFKFQSEWPYNNSQSYLLQNIVNDIKNDSSHVVLDDNDGFVITTKVNYSNNKELVNQKIYVDNDLFIKKVEVMDDNNIIKLKMDINNIDYNSNFDDNYFNLDNNMTVSLELDDGSVVSSLNDVIYPMYIPDNTYLKTQDKVSKEDGERIIMTFVGDHPFMLIQETLSNSIKNEIISVSGEPFITSGVIGIMDDSSLTWINNGVEYYLVSNSLDNYELSEVANSLTVAAITK